MGVEPAQTATIESLTDGGITGEHGVFTAPPAAVAPAFDGNQEHNTLKQSIIPFACWRAHDMRFAFESSFVLPEIATEIGPLQQLIAKHTQPIAPGGPPRKPTLTVFGHADPSGKDGFNKALSGRRAQAIYGMLTRKAELWEDLYANPLGKDQWEPAAVHAMQRALDLPVFDRPASGARKALFLAYMDKICTIPDGGSPVIPFRVEPADFLAKGADAGGKGDFQGCGEFNPIFLQSQEDIDAFEQAHDGSTEKALAKRARDDFNEPNRRVLIFLFRPGIHIRPDAWPCPRVKEGAGGCRKRFWSDGEKRRGTHLPDEIRKFDDNKDTFACRFYDRLSNNSPCEQTLSIYRIRLFDRLAYPLPYAPFIHNAGGILRAGRVGEDAFIRLRDLHVPTTVNVKWSRPNPGDGPASLPPKLNDPMEFELDVFVSIPNGDSDEAALTRLKNMGYTSGPLREDDIWAFKNDYKAKFPELIVDGKVDSRLDGATRKVIRDVHDACDPVVKTTRPPSATVNSGMQ